MKKWEYLKVRSSSELHEIELNDLGKEGWELAAALLHVVRGYGAGLTYHFKREREDDTPYRG